MKTEFGIPCPRPGEPRLEFEEPKRPELRGHHMNNSAEAPIRLAGRTLAHKRHVCAFFNSREEQNKVIIPFLKEGIDRGEKLLRIMDAHLREEYLSAYTAGGIDVQAAEQDGQFEVRSWHETYLKGGSFDGDSMIKLLEEGLEENRPKYGLTRAVGNMEWALETAPGVTDIVEYETKLNFVVTKHPDPLVCVYDLNRHSASVVMDILRTHPMVIVGGVLQENPLYVPPEEFLRELRQRKGERQANSGRVTEPHIQ
jgi:MEDS: MEthanogen/methylotroph, DcmR Sensory domain